MFGMISMGHLEAKQILIDAMQCACTIGMHGDISWLMALP